MAKRNTRDRSKSKAARRVFAAGAALWRPDPESGEPLIATIHRPRYDDWSLPKGKIDPGENSSVAAVREIFEETGQRSQLGRHLAEICYPISEGTKVVTYRTARGLGGDFEPGDEVDELRWLPVPEAAKLLTYQYDRTILDKFAELPFDTQSVLVIRHGTAGIKSRYKGDDRNRPLDKRGRAQAESLAGQLMAFGATDIYSADRARCVQTVEPLAQELGVKISIEPSLTEEAYASDPQSAYSRMLDIAASSPTPVICTQGKVIPHLREWWCARDGLLPSDWGNRKGSTSVLSLSRGRLIAVDYIASALASETI